MTHKNTLVVIPARLAASRLPDKPLARIGSEPMIIHVWKKAIAADVGPVLVACGDEAIADAVREAGGTAVMTAPDLPSGSDRVWVATETFDPDHEFDHVINVQGDLPTMDPRIVNTAIDALVRGKTDIGTLVAEITDKHELEDRNVVKVAIDFPPGVKIAPALYFSRSLIPSGEGPVYHHIGIYSYTRRALSRFVKFQPSGLEVREQLEQLRGLTNGMTISAGLVDSVPFGVDTPADLERARQILAP
ncbi:MAG: 3-deoxy-manno-octulosonate cytidylyltransferase [Rhodospirillaceae bacterium]